MSSTLQNILELSQQEKRELQASIAHRKGRRLGHSFLLVETQPGILDSFRPFFYLGWGLDNCLGAEQPVFCLPYGIRARKPTTYIKTLAALYVNEIRTVQPDGPYLLGGACFGGWVAFEMAQQLQAQGQKVSLLVLVERGGLDPIYRRYQPLVFRLVSQWRYLLALSFPEQLKYVLGLARRVLYRIVSKFFENDEGNDDDERGIQPNISNDYHEKVMEAQKLATQSYIPQPYSGRVALFFASNSERISFLFPRGGWGKLITGELDVHIVPGNHISLLEEPHVQVLGEKLRACLNAAQLDR